MSTNLKILDIYDFPSATGIPITELFYCEPVAVGTASVESVSSFFARLALAHHIGPTTLFTAKIRPRMIQALISGNRIVPWYYSASPPLLFNNIALYINGINDHTQQLVTILEELTKINNLRSLTMLPFIGLMSPSRLMRTWAAWCPACYQDQHNQNQPIYDQLLWSLESVETCAEHNMLLQHRCPFSDCGHSFRRLRTNYQPGYCPYCNRWLGQPLPTAQLDQDRANGKIYDDFKTREMRSLLAATNEIRQPLNTIHLRHAIEATMRAYAGGSPTTFGRAIGLSNSSVLDIIVGRMLPTAEVLLKICYAFGVPLYDLVIKSQEENIAGAQLPIKTRKKHTKCPKFTQIENDEIVTLLETTYPPLSLSQFAAKLKLSKRCLTNHYPQLAAKVIQHNRTYCATKLSEKVEAIRFGLEEILMLESSIRLSVTRISRNFGASPTVFYRNFPDLCKQISQRYEDQRAEQSLKRREERNNAIRETAQMLHKQGIYPSRRRLDTACSPTVSIFGDRSCRATLREVQAELGLSNNDK
jgi:hypothetical protein